MAAALSTAHLDATFRALAYVPSNRASTVVACADEVAVAAANGLLRDVTAAADDRPTDDHNRPDPAVAVLPAVPNTPAVCRSGGYNFA